MECEHRTEWIRQRDDGDYYCTVCRMILDEEDIDESIRQGRGTPTE